MSRTPLSRRLALAVLLTIGVALPVAAQWPPTEFKNLQALPKDIPPAQLLDQMRGYTRALGVRCTACHVGEEGQPMSTYKFDADDKPAKKKAREMIKMTQDLNSKYLANLPDREDPPIAVTCFTCHRGVREPRTLQDVLQRTYDKGGVDSTIARYNALRERYYGRAAYDFGEVAVADVAMRAAQAQHVDDAVRLYALNVEMNPKSNFAKRQHAIAAIAAAYRDAGPAAGQGAYEDFQSRYGDEIVGDDTMTEVAGWLRAAGKPNEAVAVLSGIVQRNPKSSMALANLGDGYANAGDKKRAKEAYQKALKADPANAHAKEGLANLAKKGK
jgi:tetratricopeptide (TPR) repeat protein